MKRRVRVMRLKAAGILFVVGLAGFIFTTGAEANAKENTVVEVKGMVINESPIEVKADEVETVEKVDEFPAEETVKFFDIGLTQDEQILMRNICDATGVDYAFALALMQSESNFRWVEGDKNLKHHAIGYFQISTINEERMESQYGLDIYDRSDNIEAGIRIIAELQEQFKDGYRGYFDTQTCVVMGYKCGVGRGKELMSDGIVLQSVGRIKADMEAFR